VSPETKKGAAEAPLEPTVAAILPSQQNNRGLNLGGPYAQSLEFAKGCLEAGFQTCPSGLANQARSQMGNQAGDLGPAVVAATGCMPVEPVPLLTDRPQGQQSGLW